MARRRADDDEDEDAEEEEVRPRRSRRKSDFTFEGTAGSYLIVGILATLLTVFTFGIGYPWAACMYLNWSVANTRIEGRPLRFRGTGGEMFGLWIKWFVLIIITLGIYSFWVVPEIHRWVAERTEFDD